MVATFLPPFCSTEQVVPQVRERGFAILAPDTLAQLCQLELLDLHALAPLWENLPPDQYLKDGGRYRQRRHSCFVVEDEQVILAPHRAHWQSLDYNALHGGMQRWFEPLPAALSTQPVWTQLVAGLAGLCSRLRPSLRWYVEAHQFRIDTADGIGRPTPEGAHRDGVDFVAVALVNRLGIKGGETRVFAAAGPDGQRFTLSQPWSLMFLDDERVIHESTPIQPLENEGHRDTLVLTFRAAGFQGDDDAAVSAE